MKFVQALCETVTRALGLSAFSPWDQDTAQQPVGPVPTFHDIKFKGPETIRGGAHGTPVFETHLGQPTQALHTLFPQKPQRQREDPFKDDPFRAQTDRHGAPGGIRGSSLQAQRLPGWHDQDGHHHKEAVEDDSHLPPGPIFAPPNGQSGFVCDYSAMRGWRHAAGSSNRNGWIEKPIMDSDSTGGVYNIFTNYDQYAPTGITRQVREFSRRWCKKESYTDSYFIVPSEHHRPEHQRRWHEQARWRQSHQWAIPRPRDRSLLG